MLWLRLITAISLEDIDSLFALDDDEEDDDDDEDEDDAGADRARAVDFLLRDTLAPSLGAVDEALRVIRVELVVGTSFACSVPPHEVFEGAADPLPASSATSLEPIFFFFLEATAADTDFGENILQNV